MNTETTITTEKRGTVMLIALNRPAKLNSFTAEMLGALGDAYTRYEEDDALRCAVVFAHGKDFTSGLDLADVAPRVARGEALWPASGVDPWGIEGRVRTKPVVIAMQGRVYTLGIELALASDVRLCSEDASFAQLEVARGIFPFGGATFRAPAQLGWGNAMRFLLTAEPFGAPEALRIGLVQEVVAGEQLLARAVAIADRIAVQAPLGVRATLESARAEASVTDTRRRRTLYVRRFDISWERTTREKACSPSSSVARRRSPGSDGAWQLGISISRGARRRHTGG